MDRIRSMYDISNDGVMELKVNQYYQVIDRDESSRKIRVINELGVPMWYSEVFFDL